MYCLAMSCHVSFACGNGACHFVAVPVLLGMTPLLKRPLSTGTNKFQFSLQSARVRSEIAVFAGCGCQALQGAWHRGIRADKLVILSPVLLSSLVSVQSFSARVPFFFFFCCPFVSKVSLMTERPVTEPTSTVSSVTLMH